MTRVDAVVSSSPFRPDINATSLTFFLVMPVQRIARYPLLLQTIQKHTDGRQPASGLLQQTVHASIAINCRINEYKRFREVGENLRPGEGLFLPSAPPLQQLPVFISADKYKKTEQLSIKEKINRISTHSIAKKTARISQHFKHEAGLTPKVATPPEDATLTRSSLLTC